MQSSKIAWSSGYRAAHIIGEHVLRTVFAEIGSHFFHVAFEQGVGRNDGVAELADQESEMRGVIALAAIIAARRAHIGDEGQSAAFLQPHLTGTLPFGQQGAVFAAAPEYVPGDGGGAHFHGAEARAPVPVETVPGDVPRIARQEVESIPFVPFDAARREHDRRTDRFAGETMAPVAGELVVRHKAVPPGDLHAAPFVSLKDTVPDNENPNAQEMHSVS